MQIENDISQDLCKTKIKQHMNSLQDLGIKLVGLSKNQLAKFDLEEQLVDAIKLAKTITSHSALKRQYQYIGKLMRDCDEEYIRKRLAFVQGESEAVVCLQHDCEKWRNELIANDEALELFIQTYKSCDITTLRQLIRNARKELTLGQNKHYRKLFQFISTHVQLVMEK